MPFSTLARILAFGLATLGLSPVAAPVASPPTSVTVDAEPAVASRIDPRLLNNPALRRALSTVGPELMADPQVRAAVEAGRVDERLLSNPRVSRALTRVAPQLLADPELNAAWRSGELNESLLRDPAVIRLLMSMVPASAEEEVEVEEERVASSPSAELRTVRRASRSGHATERAEHARDREMHGRSEGRAQPRRQRAHGPTSRQARPGRGNARHAERPHLLDAMFALGLDLVEPVLSASR